MKIIDRLKSYRKVEKVIKSCVSRDQLWMAERMMEQYQKLYKTSAISLEIHLTNQMRRINIEADRRRNAAS
jgi:Leu/Phe-tRNA-protein transferase